MLPIFLPTPLWLYNPVIFSYRYSIIDLFAFLADSQYLYFSVPSSSPAPIHRHGQNDTGYYPQTHAKENQSILELCLSNITTNKESYKKSHLYSAFNLTCQKYYLPKKPNKKTRSKHYFEVMISKLFLTGF